MKWLDPNAELTKISLYRPSKFNLIPTFCGLKWPGNNGQKKSTKISSSQSGS